MLNSLVLNKIFIFTSNANQKGEHSTLTGGSDRGCANPVSSLWMEGEIPSFLPFGFYITLYHNRVKTDSLSRAIFPPLAEHPVNFRHLRCILAGKSPCTP